MKAPTWTSSTPTLVVGVDFTESSIAALDQAIRLAASWPNSKIVVVWARAVATEQRPGESETTAGARAMERLRNAIGERFQLFERTGLRVPKMDIVAQLSNDGPAESLHATAYLEGADMIIVGSSDKNAVNRLVLGSVSRDVLDGAPCSVFVFRPRADEDVPSIEPPPAPHEHVSTLGKRHTYHYESRVGQPDSTLPLLIPMER